MGKGRGEEGRERKGGKGLTFSLVHATPLGAPVRSSSLITPQSGRVCSSDARVLLCPGVVHVGSVRNDSVRQP